MTDTEVETLRRKMLLKLDDNQSFEILKRMNRETRINIFMLMWKHSPIFEKAILDIFEVRKTDKVPENLNISIEEAIDLPIELLKAKDNRITGKISDNIILLTTGDMINFFQRKGRRLSRSALMIDIRNDKVECYTKKSHPELFHLRGKGKNKAEYLFTVENADRYFEWVYPSRLYEPKKQEISI
jgi:hypothetical protein